MSDSCEGAFGGGKLEGKVARKHHRRSTRVRSRQERASRPRLTILNVSSQAEQAGETGQAGAVSSLVSLPACPLGVQHG